MESFDTWIKYSNYHSFLPSGHPLNCIVIYYSIKIFPRFELVETTCIIHHNQLLFTKFGKNLRHTQSMTSKVEPTANYSTVDVKMTSKVEPAADYSTVDLKNLGRDCDFREQKDKERSGETLLRSGKYFE